MAQTVANDMVKDKEKALKAAQNAKSKGGATVTEKIAAEKERKANIAKAQQELDAWKAIASVQANRQQAYEEIVAAEEAEENALIVEAPVAEVTEEVAEPIAEEAETNQYPAPTRSEEGREETVATPVALAYLLEGGKGSIENAGYFLYGIQAAFPHIAAELQRVRDSIPSELLGMTPDSFVASNPHQLQEMRNFVAQSYGDKGVELFDKLTANSTGFIPREGKKVGLELENLTPVEAQVSQYDNQGNPIDENGVKQASDAVNFSVNDAKGKGKKNTAVAESTNHFNADASSGSLVQSAHHSSTATLSVSFDSAKIRKKTGHAKNNIKKFKNGDTKVNTNGGISNVLNNLRRFFGMDYAGNSNYAVFNTPNGTMAFRLSTHNANGENFAQDNSAMNVSVYIARNEYEQPESSVPFDEYRISEEDFNNNKEDFVKSLIESVDDALTTGEFTQPRHTEKVVEDGAKLWDMANAQAKANAEAVEAKRVEAIKETAQRWSKKLGAKVQILESIDDVKNKQARQEIENAEKRGTRVRAWYGSKNGVTYVYLPHIVDEQEVSEVMAHEIVAHKGLKGLLGEEGYSDLCERVFYNVMTTEQQQRFLKYPGVNGNKAKAAHEFIAHLAEAIDVESQTAWQKFVDMLRVALEKLAESVTGKGKEFSESFTNAEHLQSLLRESYRNMAKESQKMTEAQMRELESPVSVKNDGTLSFSMTTYHDWTDSNGVKHQGTRDMVIARMQEKKFTENQIKEMTRKMDTAYDYMRKLETLTDENGRVRFDEFVEWAKSRPYYKQVGKDYVKAITSLVNNGDYPINLELTTDCIKREAYTKSLNEMVKRGADLSQMGPGEIVTIQKMMKQYGIEVACELCFVEGKRLQIVNWAQQIVDDWNTSLNEAGFETDEEFRFGKDGEEFIPVEDWETYKDKTALRKAQRILDEVGLIAQGLDPTSVKAQKEANDKAVLAYMKEKRDAWAKRTKKDPSKWTPSKEQRREIKKLQIEGMTPSYVVENMNEYREAFDRMRAQWVEKNPKKDVMSFTPTKKQWEALDKIRNKQISDVKQKMIRLIMEYPEMRKKMSLNDLLGSKGLMDIRQQHGEAYDQLYSIILQRFGTGTPKPVQDAVPYDGEVMGLSETDYNKANKIGGARLFSFSDFDITKTFDYMQMFFDLEANKQKLQSYTKEIAAILIFGRSNAKMNISTLAKATVPESVKAEYKEASEEQKKELRHKWAENAGLIVDENGNIVGINFSEEHSVSPEFAKTIFHDDTRNKDCGAIMVGCSVNHAIYSALQNWIRMVIPFHLSGMPIAAREKTDVLWYTDNTAFQSTRKKVDGGWKKISASEDTFSFYDDMDKKGWNMRDKTRQYLAWCEEHGYRPKFDWGINSQKYIEYCEAEGYTPNQQLIEAMDADTIDGVWNQYYKFLTDFTAYKPIFNEHGEMIDEVPSPQQAIVTNFDMTELEKQVLYEADNSMLAHRESNIDKTQQYIDEIADKVEQYLSGNLSEENMDLKEDVFYENNADAERYLEELEVHEGVRFRFLGENGAERLDHAEEASTRLDNLAVAREMESAGAEAKNIKMATGWERGADNKWRYETNDIKVKDWDWTVKAKRNLTLKDIIDDEELFIAYPSLANVSVKKTSSYGGGSYNKESNTIKVGTGILGLFVRKGADVPESTKNEVLDTLVHEIQHVIQHEEGFAVGGSPDMYRPGTDTSKLEQKIDDYNEAANAFNLQSEWYRRSPQAQRELDALNKLHKEIQKERKALQLGEEGYHRLAGEVEAYNVGKRKGMTYEERLASLATETEDVAREDQLFIYDSLESEQAATGTAFSGGGLVEAGLKDLIDSKFAIEYDEKIAGVYRNNHGDHILVADIRGVDIEELASEVDGGLDYFHASPVCKRFSTMRATQGETALDIETAQATADIISEKQPKVVTIENVPQYKNSEAMSVITDALDANGYTWDANVYNSADYGAATSRRRLIVRAVKDGALPPMPQKVKEKRGWYEVVEDLVADLPTTSLAPWQRERLEADGIIPEEVKEPLFVFDGGGKNGKARYAYGSSPLPTITASGSADRIVMPGGEVKLVSPRVLARIMGLPDSYQLPESRTLAHTILGNGVPVEMTEAVIAPMLEQFQEDDGIRFRASQTEFDEIAEEEAKIIAEAKENGTYLKAPNGKASKLSPEQWVQVRTSRFKEWFGDWELAYKKNYLLNGKAVSTLAGNEFSKVEGKTLTYQVEEFFNSIGNKAISPIYGEVILDRKGADDSLAHGMGRKKAVAYAAVKDVIENGIVIGYDSNHKNRGYDSVIIAAPININKERHICEVVITRMDDNRFYLHEVTPIKKLQGAVFLTNSGQSPSAHLGVAAKILQNIVSTSDDVSKVVDENGEPLVVYHGTDEEFYEFKLYEDTGVTNRYDERPSDHFLFTPNVIAASDYGETMPLYIKAEKLLRVDDKYDVSDIISKKAIGKYLDKTALSKSDNQSIHLSALKRLPDIISESIFVEIHPDYKKGDDELRSVNNEVGSSDLLVHRMYGAITIEENTYRVKTTLHEFKNKSIATTPHSYEVTEIEPLEGTLETTHAQSADFVPTSNNSIVTTNLLNGVENSNGLPILNSSKIVNENGEPMVVYHGTNDGGFSIFNTDGIGKTRGTGAWFSDSERNA